MFLILLSHINNKTKMLKVATAYYACCLWGMTKILFVQIMSGVQPPDGSLSLAHVGQVFRGRIK